MCAGGNLSGYIPTHTSPTSSGLIPGNLWRNFSSWMPQRETASSQNLQSTQDGRFPGTGRTLGAVVNQSSGAVNTESSLQARLLDNSSPDHLSETTATGTGQFSNTRDVALDNATAVAQPLNSGAFDEELMKLVAMGFEKTQAEVALTAAEGDKYCGGNSYDSAGVIGNTGSYEDESYSMKLFLSFPSLSDILLELVGIVHCFIMSVN
ncbi:hypothetical protein MKX01_026350 [Papaver californicum]|nr:hypothetical protein MKX01_026350 [Papaver californicum]